jgi:hypothetical protein
MYHSGKIRTLGKFFLKLEMKGKDGSRRKLILILFSYLIPGIFLPLLLFKQNADPTGFNYAFLSFLFFSLIVTFNIVSQFDNILISKTEADIFTIFPVDDEIVVNAKMYVIWRYMFMMSLPLLIPGSIFFYLIMRSIPRAAMYFISGLLLFLFILYTLLLIYSIAIRAFKIARLGTLTLFFQVLIVFLIIVGYQFASYSFTGRIASETNSFLNFFSNKDFMDALPPAWFGFLPARHNNIQDIRFILKIFLPLVVVYFSYLSLKMYLLENFPVMKEKFLTVNILNNSSKLKWNDSVFSVIINYFIYHIYINNSSENASFSLMRSLFKRDKTVGLNILPMIVIPVGLAVFAFITNQLQSPFPFDYFGSRPIFHISILVSVLIILQTGVLGVKVTNNTEVTWVYDAFPMTSKKRFINGIRKFFVIYLLTPICIFLFILFSFKMQFSFAVIHTLFIFACGNLFNSLIHIFQKDLPFTKENTLFNSVVRIASIPIPLIFGLLFIVIQLFAYKNLFTSIITVIAILTVTFWINYFSLRIK